MNLYQAGDKLKIYVDADACPVKQEIIEEASIRRIPVVLVKSYAHFSLNNEPGHVKTIYVDSEAESADYRILQLIQKDDLLVTQDYGLASLILEKGAVVLHHSGYEYTKQNIEELLQMRHASAKARKSGHRTKGPKRLTKDDKEEFRLLLRKKLTDLFI